MPEVATRDIAAIVILYRPGAGVPSDIALVAAQVDHVFAMDNTEQPDPALANELSRFANLTYIALGDNLGVAAALNRGMERVRASGHSWALTMDQDSTPEPDMVERMLACLIADEDPDTIGILSPSHHQVGGNPPEFTTGCVPALTAMMSGNLLRVSAWENAGPFMEELFIDRVDTEYCLRLATRGFRVMVAADAVLHHRVGDTRRRRFPYPAFPSNHSPLRRYYITRNRFAVSRLYASDFPDFGRFERRELIKETVKIVLYESSKVAKLRMTWRGYRDYRRGVTGRFGVGS
jgi:rhamnosyltransferase